MASEIRVNKINNRAGLGTVSYTDTGIIVSGIVTANSFKGDGSSLTGIDATALKDTAGSVKVQAQTSGVIITGVTTIRNAGGTKLYEGSGNGSKLFHAGTERLSTELYGIDINGTLGADSINCSGIITGASFSGDGSALSNLPAGAPVGGASTNTVFFENDKVVAVNYQITSTKNAMSAGPIAINAGIAVTVPSGCSWTIV